MDVLLCQIGPLRPGDVAAVADLVILCHERALALELAADHEISCGGCAVGHKEEAIPPPSAHADSPGGAHV